MNDDKIRKLRRAAALGVDPTARERLRRAEILAGLQSPTPAPFAGVSKGELERRMREGDEAAAAVYRILFPPPTTDTRGELRRVRYLLREMDYALRSDSDILGVPLLRSVVEERHRMGCGECRRTFLSCWNPLGEPSDERDRVCPWCNGWGRSR